MLPDRTFQVAFWITLALMLLVRIFFTIWIKRAGERFMPDKAAIQREGKGVFAARFVSFFLLIGLLVLYALNPSWFQRLAVPLPGWLRWAGFGIGLLGIALMGWTEAVLGRHWSAQLQLREGHQLVTAGPYAHVRHPLYTALIGFGLAVALVSASWPFILLVPVLVWGLVDRVPKEEKMLIEEFGDEYLEYMKRSGRYFPK